VLALAIPFSPLGEWFGFQALPKPVAIALAGIVVVYLSCAELFKPLAIAGGFRHAS
jgi:Mg2+-importing ATPase